MIQYKYSQAEDFSDSTALVKFKDVNILLNTEGYEVFSTGAEIEKIAPHYFLVNDDARSIINHRGEVVVAEVDQVQKVNPRLLIVTTNSGEIKLIND